MAHRQVSVWGLVLRLQVQTVGILRVAPPILFVIAPVGPSSCVVLGGKTDMAAGVLGATLILEVSLIKMDIQQNWVAREICKKRDTKSRRHRLLLRTGVGECRPTLLPLGPMSFQNFRDCRYSTVLFFRYIYIIYIYTWDILGFSNVGPKTRQSSSIPWWNQCKPSHGPRKMQQRRRSGRTWPRALFFFFRDVRTIRTIRTVRTVRTWVFHFSHFKSIPYD